jgi:hypothetical protein
MKSQGNEKWVTLLVRYFQPIGKPVPNEIKYLKSIQFQFHLHREDQVEDQ